MSCIFYDFAHSEILWRFVLKGLQFGYYWCLDYNWFTVRLFVCLFFLSTHFYPALTCNASCNRLWRNTSKYINPWKEVWFSPLSVINYFREKRKITQYMKNNVLIVTTCKIPPFLFILYNEKLFKFLNQDFSLINPWS